MEVFVDSRSCHEIKQEDRQSTEDFQGSETTLHATRMVNTCHSTFFQTHRMYATKSEP